MALLTWSISLCSSLALLVQNGRMHPKRSAAYALVCSQVPLFIAVDAIKGLTLRLLLPSTFVSIMYNNIPYARTPGTIHNTPSANMTSHPGPNSLGLSAPMVARSQQSSYGHVHQSQAQVPLYAGSHPATPQSSVVPQFPQASPSASSTQRHSTKDKDRSLLLVRLTWTGAFDGSI